MTDTPRQWPFPARPPEPKEQKCCDGRDKCSEEARYDEVSHGLTSVTLKCRLCGAIVRHDWD